VVAEKPILGWLFHRTDTEPTVAALFQQVRRIVETEPHNTITEQP
jgi:hypothetical protein